MATSTVIEFCTPPVPGETHVHYGYAHNYYLKLPQTIRVSKPVSAEPAEATLKRSEKTLHAIAASGDLILLRQILPRLPDPLKAVNEPLHPSTGMTPIHFAASRGHVNIVRCLIDEYAVSVDLRDKEGETPLLKAAYEGHFHVVQYLLSKNANIHQKDKDGWTALHNACSRGYMPIVRLLVENGARIEARSKMGHTPLINAASKGHISIVEYLLEANANPLVKNNFGEAAYDVSAAAGESYICELLQKAGQKRWDMQYIEGITEPYSGPYDLLDFHVTVMVILHENQRSSSLLGLTRLQFSAAALTKHDVRGPWSLHPSGIPKSKEEVTLPPSRTGRAGKSDWFWFTDWQIDISDPRVDPTSGWQYARSFDDPDEKWTPVEPTSGYGRVRRRRWVRVMKRRMDLAKPSHKTNVHQDDPEENDEQNDYLAKAEDLVQPKTNINSTTTDGAVDEASKSIQTLTQELRAYEESVQLLLAGMKTDFNQHRKHQATVLMTLYTARIDNLNSRIAILAPKLTTPVQENTLSHNPELARELGFVRPATGPVIHPGDSTHTTYNSHGNATLSSDFDTNPWSRDGSNDPSWQQHVAWHDNPSLNHVDLEGHRDQRNNSLPLLDPLDTDDGPRVFAWESDLDAKECRRCSRRFGLLVRRHHCRRCGLVVCDRCSASRTYLPPSEILQDPTGPLESLQVLASQHQRVCDKCYADLGMNA